MLRGDMVCDKISLFLLLFCECATSLLYLFHWTFLSFLFVFLSIFFVSHAERLGTINYIPNTQGYKSSLSTTWLFHKFLDYRSPVSCGWILTPSSLLSHTIIFGHLHSMCGVLFLSYIIDVQWKWMRNMDSWSSSHIYNNVCESTPWMKLHAFCFCWHAKFS